MFHLAEEKYNSEKTPAVTAAEPAEEEEQRGDDFICFNGDKRGE